MNELAQYHLSLGARLAPDGIPLDYGDLLAEYKRVEKGAILLDRSHEGRILLEGRDRFDLVNRMSTNDISRLAVDEGKPTVFTNPNARILFRASCYSLRRGLLLISEAGKGEALANYLRRSIFYGDQVQVKDLSAATAQFALHGAAAGMAIAAFAPELAAIAPLGCAEINADEGSLIIARRKPIRGGHWIVIAPARRSVSIHRRLLRGGADEGLLPAGSLTYNSLRIRSGLPAGIELSTDYIPLEVGLWDEISFSKGCYTGQEIIARLESRERLAKTLVKLELASMTAAPAPIYADGKSVGRLTSSAQAADGRVHALAALKLGSAHPETELAVGAEGVMASVIDYAGAQPPYILSKDQA